MKNADYPPGIVINLNYVVKEKYLQKIISIF